MPPAPASDPLAALPIGGPVPLPPADLVASIPAPVLRLLVLFSAPIAAVRASLEVALWKPERRVHSWILLIGWWLLCLGGGYAFAYLFPVLVFAPLLPLNRLRLGQRSHFHPTPTQPATSDTLLRTLGDLHKIYALLPPSPLPAWKSMYTRAAQLGAWRLTRGLLVCWGVWVVLGSVIGFRTLLALLGTAVILAPSPPLAHVMHLLSKSLAARRTAALLFVLTFGSPDRDYTFGSPIGWIKSKWAWSRRPSVALAFEKKAPAEDDEETAAPVERAGNPIYFRFELHENQRWWMGLDWTSALLPQERPSWCDSHLLPVSPPQAFSLPAPSSIDVPAPTKAEPRAMVRRTATWRWLDDDWHVVRAGPGAAAAAATIPATVTIDETPVAPARPQSGLFSSSPEDSHARAPSIAEQAFAKGLGRLKGVPLGVSPSPSQSPVKPRRDSEASEAMSFDETGSLGAPIAEIDDATDADGWVYGDNKWENMGAKGGLGKFTRRRRWQRRAVCTEAVHRIPDLAPLPGEGVPLDSPSGAHTPTPVSLRATGAVVPPTGLKSTAVTATAPIAPSSSGSVSSGMGSGPGTPVGPLPGDTESVGRMGRGPMGTLAGFNVDGLKDAESSAVEYGRRSLDAPRPGGGEMSRDDALRLRLKKAMGNMGG